MEVICRKLPSELVQKILFLSHSTLKKKERTEIYLKAKLLSVFRLYPDVYDERMKKMTLKIFHKISLKYKKGFVLAMEEVYPTSMALEWILQHWKDCILFVGNRKQPDSWPLIQHFFDVMYGGTMPRKISFRGIVHNVHEYVFQLGNL